MEQKGGVQGDSPNPAGAGPDSSKPGEGAGDDKELNFAKLRYRAEKAEAELERIKNERAPKPDEPKKPSEAQQAIFNRDLKEAKRQFQSKAKGATAEELAALEKLQLSGEETESEILEKMTNSYEGLPSVRQRREKEIADKARKEAMREMTDDEYDIGGGGEVTPGGEKREPRFSTADKRILDVMGVSAEERKNIDPDANPNEWAPGKEPTRKFFEPRSSAN